jgi:S-DNA-T family DNA segregation ATPase FtsK/SpoIIIE
VQSARTARREARVEPPLAEEDRGPVIRRPVTTPVEPELVEEDDDTPARTGFFARLALRPRQAEPVEHFEDLEPELPDRARHLSDDIEAPDEEKIRARISDAIRSRIRRPNTVTAAAQRRLAADQAAAPEALHLSPALRAEPPLTANHAPKHEAEEEDNIFTEREAEEAPQPASAQPAPLPRAELQRRVVQQAAKKPSAPSRRAMADAQPSLPLQAEPDEYEFPPLNLLTNPDTIERHYLSEEALEENARMLENVLDDYGVKGEIVSVRPGPVVTMYELEPAPGLKASRVIGLADDIARSMSALSARVSTVPGRSVIGIELPNQHREKVVLREILAQRDFGDGTHKLPLALGKDIGGGPIVADLARMPHLLIAGTTGSGKSVAINTMILSLLYKLPPEDCRLIMIDPKMLELSVYDGIPHLLSPVVTDPKKAVVALKWVVAEMEERYRKMSKMGVRNIEGYNGRVAEALRKGEMFSRTVQTGFDDETGEPVFETEEFAPEKMPFIVVVVDEMADLMMVAGKEIEACIQRLAQMARASGIHIIMATQRPSVDVITGTIKANFPTRISFHVTSKVDSRTILGEQGAEQLLGMGDMLYMAGGARITRVHGPFVSDEEVEEIVRHLKSFGPPDYAASVLDGPDDEKEADIDAVLGLNTGGNTNGEDALYDQAVAIVVKDRKCSTSYIQRKLGIGYNKAARLVEQMEEQGLVSAANHVGKREILVPEPE